MTSHTPTRTNIAVESHISGAALTAVPTIAAAISWPLPPVETRARVCQRHNPPLWPTPLGRGGGKNKAYSTHWHCNNLLLSCVTSLPTTTALQAPELVLAYRAIPVSDRDSWGVSAPIDPEQPGLFTEAVLAWARTLSPSNVEGCARYRVIPGATVGEALDNLVDWISRPEGATIRNWFQTSGMWVDLGVGYAYPICSIGYVTLDNVRFQSLYYSRNGSWPLAKGQDPHPGVTTTNRVQFSVFEVLADIWADTRARTVGPTSFPPSGAGGATASPENAKRRTPPQGPARTQKQPRESETGTSNTPSLMRECASLQRSLVREVIFNRSQEIPPCPIQT